MIFPDEVFRSPAGNGGGVETIGQAAEFTAALDEVLRTAVRSHLWFFKGVTFCNKLPAENRTVLKCKNRPELVCKPIMWWLPL